MGRDDDADCVEHVWELRGVTFADDGATEDYACARCPAVMVAKPDHGPVWQSTNPAIPESSDVTTEPPS